MVKTKLRKPVQPASGPAKPRRRSKHSLGGLFVTALDITGEQATEILQRMLLIRHFESQSAKLSARKSAEITSDSRFEAIAAAGCSVLEPHDRLVTSQYPHAFILARRGDVNNAAACWAGTSDPEGVICGNMPLAAGTALAGKLDKKHGVALSFCAPDETQQGSFHEALNLISAWKLPIVIVVSDAFIPALNRPARKPRIFTRAAHYGIEGVMCDATSVLDLRQTISVACQRAREGGGATLIEAALPLPAPTKRGGATGSGAAVGALASAETGTESSLARPPLSVQQKGTAAEPVAPTEKPRGPRDAIAVFKTLLEDARLISAPEAQVLDREAATAVKEALAVVKSAVNETAARR
jgi:pyruvate dehydrogenase E1 component alpha subunit